MGSSRFKTLKRVAVKQEQTIAKEQAQKQAIDKINEMSSFVSTGKIIEFTSSYYDEIRPNKYNPPDTGGTMRINTMRINTNATMLPDKTTVMVTVLDKDVTAQGVYIKGIFQATEFMAIGWLFVEQRHRAFWTSAKSIS